jgi:hypothetical protein
MAVKLSAPRAGPLYPQEDSWYSFLLEAELTVWHSANLPRAPKKLSNIENVFRPVIQCNIELHALLHNV